MARLSCDFALTGFVTLSSGCFVKLKQITRNLAVIAKYASVQNLLEVIIFALVGYEYLTCAHGIIVQIILTGIFRAIAKVLQKP